MYENLVWSFQTHALVVRHIHRELFLLVKYHSLNLYEQLANIASMNLSHVELSAVMPLG
jgi:hypothetical protein